MPKTQITAEVRLYRWLKRKTTPPDAWQHLSLAELAKKARCSTSMVSRTLPKALAKLHSISLDAAEKWVNDVMTVRQGRLIDFEIEILKELRKKEPPMSFRQLSGIFEVSEIQIADIANALGLGVSTRGLPATSYRNPKKLIPAHLQHRIPEIEKNSDIRRRRRKKHSESARPTFAHWMWGRF